MKATRLFLLVVLVAALLASTVVPATAFIHTTIPAPDCAPDAAGVPGNNPTAQAAILAAGLTPPLGNVTKAPTDCPAP